MKSVYLLSRIFTPNPSCAAWLTLVAVFLSSAFGPLDAQPAIKESSTITIGSSDKGDAAEAYGQALVTPGNKPVIEPGVDPTPIQFESLTFYSGGADIGSPLTRLLLVRGAAISQERIDYLDAAGSPHPEVIGVSSNAIDTRNCRYGDELRFEFPKETTVEGGETVCAVFVRDLEENVFSPISVSVAYIRFAEDSPGVYRPVENIGGDQDAEVAALFADFSGDGNLDMANDSTDVCFLAVFRASGDEALEEATGLDTGSKYTYPALDLKISNHSPFTRAHYPKRIEDFQKNPLKFGQVVMLGDSHTEQFDWNREITAGVTIANRGISGDTTDGVSKRLDEIIASHPSSVFILIGTNDLWTDASPRQIASKIENIAIQIHKGSPESLVYIQTVIPIRSEPSLNVKIDSINAELLSRQTNSGYRVIDLNPLLRDENGSLRSEFTRDGVHLTPKGYQVWVELISKNIADANEFPTWQELEERHAGDYFFRGPAAVKHIALTFDDGPSAISERVIDLLERLEVKATFFWQGNHVADNLDVIKRALDGGHTVANHSWDHPNGQDMTPEELWFSQVLPTLQAFEDHAGHRPMYFRPPFGVISEAQIEYLAQKGFVTIAWSISSLDWDESKNSPDQMVDTVLSELHPGAIILFHDYFRGEPRDELFETLERVIHAANTRGYKFVTVDELLTSD